MSGPSRGLLSLRVGPAYPTAGVGRTTAFDDARRRRANTRDPGSEDVLERGVRGAASRRRRQDSPVRILTWNVAGRVARQGEAVRRAGADVVALQEVTARTLPLWRAALAEAGLASCECALDDAPAGSGRRPLGVLTAAREPLRRLAPPSGVPWPERVLCCALGETEIVNVHSPIAPAPDLAKVRTHEAVAAYLS